MTPGEVEYRGMLAETWDLFRGDTSNWSDRPFYLGFIEEFGQPALDVGCATGRLLLDYLAQGIDIDGVDVSSEMLSICNEKAGERGLEPNLYLQPVEALDLPRKYRTILVPSSSFQLLIEPEQVREAMRRLYSHLEPGGALVMPFMLIWREGQPLEEENVREVVRPSDGATVRRIARSRYEPLNQLEHTETVFQVLLEGDLIDEEIHLRSPATRWYNLDEAVELYRETGFQRILAYSGFTREPYSEGDELFTLVGVK
jgi:ubiquinone/menaquinone biosynthesis C-methylase UbiE